MDQTAVLQALLSDDPLRRQALGAVAALNLSDCWIGAGFVRDAAWDYLHGYRVQPPHGDVDVIWFSGALSEEDIDRSVEGKLCGLLPGLTWSVKNQARMHLHNGDSPYATAADAMRHWPETATAVAARLDASGLVEINAPFGLEDLFALRLRPTSAFQTGEKRAIFDDRVSSKRWIERYPMLAREAEK